MDFVAVMLFTQQVFHLECLLLFEIKSLSLVLLIKFLIIKKLQTEIERLKGGTLERQITGGSKLKGGTSDRSSYHDLCGKFLQWKFLCTSFLTKKFFRKFEKVKRKTSE